GRSPAYARGPPPKNPMRPAAAPSSARRARLVHPCGPNVTSGAAESYEALGGFGPSLLSVLDAMRRSRECRVLTAGTEGAKTGARQRAEITQPRVEGTEPYGPRSP